MSNSLFPRKEDIDPKEIVRILKELCYNKDGKILNIKNMKNNEREIRRLVILLNRMFGEYDRKEARKLVNWGNGLIKMLEENK